jgi:hypothetical protein
MGGSNSGNQPGVYGALGVPAPGNIPGGRFAAVSWTDSNGHFWMFGGAGYDANGTFGDLNDLWEFDLSTNEWTWMGGSSTVPGPSAGQPGVYGTLGVPAPGNIPGGRIYATSWTDRNGNLWLFAGASDIWGNFDDLWKFDPSTNEWAWMGGGAGPAFGGNWSVYGTLGVPAPGNTPGGRYGASSWTDGNSHLWLFGGNGNGVNGNQGDLNDLWKFDPSTNEWAWMGGGSGTIPCTPSGWCGSPGVYGTLGALAAGNNPGGRLVALSWIDNSGNLWLFGGGGFDANGTPGNLNDLWQFNPSANEWAWMGGSSTVPNCGSFGNCGQPGVYGTLGTPAPGNIPGGRGRGAYWTDSGGHLWLFGGGDENDLWEYWPVRALVTPVITWPPPAAITYPTALSTKQLDATTTIPGTFTYSPAAGAVLGAGKQTLHASFTPKDSTNYASVTVTTSLTVTPADLWVRAFNAERPYGAANPTFSGQVRGAVSGDAFTETFSTVANATSAPGRYGIVPAVTPTGNAQLSNYNVHIANGTLKVIKALSSTTLTVNPAKLSPHVHVTLRAKVTPATSGTPTGKVSFYDGSTLLGTTPLSGGETSLALSGLPHGEEHRLIAVYSGDADFRASSSIRRTGDDF